MSFSLANLFRTKRIILDLSGEYARMISATYYRSGALATFSARTFTEKNTFSPEYLTALAREVRTVGKPAVVILPEFLVRTEVVMVAKKPLEKDETSHGYVFKSVRFGAFLKEYKGMIPLSATVIGDTVKEYRATVLLVAEEYKKLVEDIFGSIELVSASMSLARLVPRDTLDHFVLSDTLGGALIAYVREGRVIRSTVVEGKFPEVKNDVAFFDAIAHAYKEQLVELYSDGIKTHDEVRVVLYGIPAQIENADSFFRISFGIPALATNPWKNIVLPVDTLPPLPLSDSYHYASTLGELVS